MPRKKVSELVRGDMGQPATYETANGNRVSGNLRYAHHFANITRIEIDDFSVAVEDADAEVDLG